MFEFLQLKIFSKNEEIPGFWSLLERSPGEAASTKVSAGYAIG